MKNLAPEIFRQRLLIEAKYAGEISEEKILNYFQQIAKVLSTHVYGKPQVHFTGGKGKWINQGYDAFAPLVDSGISLYAWTNAKFISVLIYTCKKFDPTKVLEFTRNFFDFTQMESLEF